jgi:hypothetical protein
MGDIPKTVILIQGGEMEKSVTDTPCYEKTFSEWLAKLHPEITLKHWQAEAAGIILRQVACAGKTELINLLAEYDQSTCIIYSGDI